MNRARPVRYEATPRGSETSVAPPLTGKGLGAKMRSRAGARFWAAVAAMGVAGGWAVVTIAPAAAGPTARCRASWIRLFGPDGAETAIQDSTVGSDTDQCSAARVGGSALISNPNGTQVVAEASTAQARTSLPATAEALVTKFTVAIQFPAASAQAPVTLEGQMAMASAGATCAAGPVADAQALGVTINGMPLAPSLLPTIVPGVGSITLGQHSTTESTASAQGIVVDTAFGRVVLGDAFAAVQTAACGGWMTGTATTADQWSATATVGVSMRCSGSKPPLLTVQRPDGSNFVLTSLGSLQCLDSDATDGRPWDTLAGWGTGTFTDQRGGVDYDADIDFRFVDGGAQPDQVMLELDADGLYADGPILGGQLTEHTP